MHNPCLDCRYGPSYTETCKNKCEYSTIISKLNELRSYSTLDEAIEILKGNRFPTVFIDKDHIDFTYKIVHAAKEGLI